MVNRKYKGGSKIPKPQFATFPNGTGTARDAAISHQNNDAEQLNQLNNHTHGDGSQIGGADCTGGPVPLAPTFGVPQGVGHMGSHEQSTANYNQACQQRANAELDSQVEMPKPQTGGNKRYKKHKTHRHKKSKRRHNKTMKTHHKKTRRHHKKSNRRHKKSQHKRRHKK